MITSHKFRMTQNSQQGIDPGMCTWLGTCNQPADRHQGSRIYQRYPADVRDAAVADYLSSGDSIRAVAKRHGISFGGLRRMIIVSGGDIRPRSESRTRS